MENEGVIIVGAGTVGLATALGLARAGIDVRVLEARDAAVTEPRDILYHWSVLEGLSGLGVLADCERVGLRSDRWAHKVLKTGEIIRFSLSLIADEIPTRSTCILTRPR